MPDLAARTIFTPAAGFIKRGGFDYTCNPYVGCTFGCEYCYAKHLPQNRRPQSEWGRWFDAKANAGELAGKHAAKLAGKAVYISSVTDPYQPAERSRQLTRRVLEALLRVQARVVIQTRSHLVMRDLDILSQFQSARVNITIPTDDDATRRLFEPKAPPLESRWLALTECRAAGVPTGLCVTPALPLTDVTAFVDRICGLLPDVLVAQDFHDAAGRFGADTSPEARARAAELRWDAGRYAGFVATLRAAYPGVVHEGEAGFFPPPASAC